MQHITSRKNKILAELRALASDAELRKREGRFVCDGEKLLREAFSSGAEIDCVLWGEKPALALQNAGEEYTCPDDLLQYASPLKNTRGPVFSVRIKSCRPERIESAIVLENVQDPGNVGTVLRTASAMGTDLVVLTGECADLYSPKTVRSTMGAIFRQSVLETDIEGIKKLVSENSLALYGAALSESASDIRKADLSRCAVAIGSEGRGLSRELLDICSGEVIIPMDEHSESLNAAVAASIVMWEMARQKGEN